MRSQGLLFIVCLVWVFAPTTSRAGDMDPATGYRVQNYRAPVPLPPIGGTRVDLDGVDHLRREGAVLVDVMPARAGYDPATGKWRLVEPRDDIPGSVWLPNTGRGDLEPRLQQYFTASLGHLTKGRTDTALVFYCMADCWMSWNAVKRAAALGYTHVAWFADGTDGWAAAGRDLRPASPPPVPAVVETTPGDPAITH